MKARILIGSLVLVASTAMITSRVISQDHAKPPEMTPEQQEMMKKWMDFATPNENHKLLGTKVGKWTATVTMWEDPNAPPQSSKATSEITSIMEGRYLSDNTDGSFMDMPFHGHSISGYDNLKKKFIWVWIDNMGTGFMVAEGTYDAATKTFNYKSEAPDLMTGKYVPVRTVEKMTDNDHWTMQMFGTKDGKEFKNMEIVYTRAK